MKFDQDFREPIKVDPKVEKIHVLTEEVKKLELKIKTLKRKLQVQKIIADGERARSDELIAKMQTIIIDAKAPKESDIDFLKQ